MRDNLRKNGYFLTGNIDANDLTDEITCSVNTFERTNPRDNVVRHSSDDNYSDVPNIFLTQRFGDLPAPAGVFPWV